MNSGKKLCHTRRLGSSISSEQLERRMLLAVSPAEYIDIRASYSALNLPATMAQINIIEITTANLSVANLKAAIQTAATTNLPDLVVLRATETQNTITYASSADEINIDIRSSKGAISIVSIGWGVGLDANGLSRVLTVGTQEPTTIVKLGGIVIGDGQTGESGNGGGLYQGGGVLTLEDVSFCENSAIGDGGGMYQEAGQSTLVSVGFDCNSAGGDGAGMYVHSGSSAITEVQFDQNFGTGNGGALCVAGGNVSIVYAHIDMNFASHDGGALYQSGNASLSLTNAEITGDEFAHTGGIVQNGGTSVLSNVTIAQHSGGGIALLSGSMTLNNSIVAQNTDSGGQDVYVANGGGSLVGHHSLIGNGVGQSALVNGVDGNLVGTAAVPIDPMFVYIGGITDLGLAQNSPARNAGDNALIPSGITTDAGVRPRIVYGTVDMGAYERGLDLVFNGTGGNDAFFAALLFSGGGPIPDMTVRFTVNGVVTDYEDTILESVTINGLAGDDSISFSDLLVPCTIDGGLGNDRIYSGRDDDFIRGDDGNDTINGGGGNDTIMGNAGNDSLNGDWEDDVLQGGLGNDTLDGNYGNDSLYGGDQMDSIYGNEGDDYIEGKGKADTIRGGGGNDTIYGGAGSDLIYGDGGDDWIDVGRSSAFVDSVYGGAGTDTVLADANDILNADIESVVLA